jgi:hypothetical protein
MNATHAVLKGAEAMSEEQAPEAPVAKRRSALHAVLSPQSPVLVLVLLLAAACGSKKAPAAVATRAPTPTPTPTPQERIQSAAQHMQALSAFHFLLTHENGASAIALGLQMTRAEGDFENPNRFKATVDAKALGGIAVTVKVINVADKTWITNPLLGGDHYQILPNGTSAAAIFDPNTGIFKAAHDIKDPQLTGSDKIGSVDTWVVQGTVDAGDLTSIATDAQAGHQVTMKVWIGKEDSLVYRIRLEGPLSDSEPKNIARQIDLTQFNEKLDIQPPA